MKLLGTAEMTTAHWLGMRAFLLHHHENPVPDSRRLWPKTVLIHRSFRKKGLIEQRNSVKLVTGVGTLNVEVQRWGSVGIGPRCIFLFRFSCTSMWSQGYF